MAALKRLKAVSVNSGTKQLFLIGTVYMQFE